MRCLVQLGADGDRHLVVVDLVFGRDCTSADVLDGLEDTLRAHHLAPSGHWWVRGRPIVACEPASRVFRPGVVIADVVAPPVAMISDDGYDAGELVSLGTGRHRIPTASDFVDVVSLPKGDVSVTTADGVVQTELPIRIRSTGGALVVSTVPRAPAPRVELRLPPKLPLNVEPLVAPKPADAAHRPAFFSAASLVMPLVAGGAMAYFFRSPMYLVFTILSPLMMLGNLVEGRFRRRTSARQVAQEKANQLRGLVEELTARHEAVWNTLTASLPGPALLEEAAHRDEPGSVWTRHNDDQDAWLVSLGTHLWRWDPPITGELVGDDLDEFQRWLGVPETPLPFALGESAALGIIGERTSAQALARSLLTQLAVHHRPADLALAVVTDQSSTQGYGWSKLLPHAASDGLAVASDTEAIDDLIQWLDARETEGRHGVLVVDDQAACTGHEGLRSSIGARKWAAVVIVGDHRELPPGISDIADLEAAKFFRRAGRAERAADRVAPFGHPPVKPPWHSKVEQDAEQTGESFQPVGLCQASEHRIGSAIATRTDAVSLPGGGALGKRVLLGDLLAPVTEAQRSTRTGLASPLGVCADGVLSVDLVADGPHALVAGTTGAGKSELLRAWVLGLAHNYSPHEVQFMLVDYKGGSAFDICATLPHTVGVITDLDGHLGERALISLDSELRRREHLLRQAGVDRIEDCPRNADLARLVIVIDEFATMASELPDVMDRIVGVAQRGRSLGVHLILATQRPAGVVNDKIRANTNLRVALRVQDQTDSADVLGVADAAHLPRTAPGRAIVRVGSDQPVTFQGALPEASVDADSAPECFLVSVVSERRTTRHGVEGASSTHVDPVTPTAVPGVGARARENAQERGLGALAASVSDKWSGVAEPRPVWLPPLPNVLAGPQATAGNPIPLAATDDPEAVRHDTFDWDFAAGPLLMCGTRTSGVATAVEVVVDAVQTALPEAWCYIVDDEFGWQDRPKPDHVGEIIRTEDEERVRSLLSLAERSATPDHPILMIITNWDSLASRLQFDVGPTALWDRLARLIGEGSTKGVYSVIVGRRPGSFPAVVSATATQRLWFATADPSDLLGHVPSRLTSQLAAPGRCVALPDGLLGQCYQAASNSAVQRFSGLRPPPAKLPVMPLVVDAPDDLQAERAGNAWKIPVGIANGGADVGHLELWPGEHAVIAGNARSGKSQTLAMMARLISAHDGVDTFVIAGQRSPLRGADVKAGLIDPTDLDPVSPPWGSGPCSRPTVVMVDDADLLGNLDDVLGPRLESHDPLFQVIVTGNPDRLRRMYGTWVAAVRSHRRGLLLCPENDFDGEVLGNSESFRGSKRLPGRGYLIADGAKEQIQVFRYVVPVSGEGLRSMTAV